MVNFAEPNYEQSENIWLSNSLDDVIPPQRAVALVAATKTLPGEASWLDDD